MIARTKIENCRKNPKELSDLLRLLNKDDELGDLNLSTQRSLKQADSLGIQNTGLSLLSKKLSAGIQSRIAKQRALTRDQQIDKGIDDIKSMCRVTDQLFNDPAYMQQIRKEVRSGTASGLRMRPKPQNEQMLKSQQNWDMKQLKLEL